VTEGDSVEDALANVQNALAATVELYEDFGKVLPEGLVQDADAGVIQFDHLLLTA
jgi:antitoxin HicB